MPDINAEYSVAVKRATDRVYRFAVAFEERFAPCDAPRTREAITQIHTCEFAILRLRHHIGIPESTQSHTADE